MVQALLLTGPEVVDVVRDIILIVFLIFAFFALALFSVVTLLLYRRTAGLIETVTAAIEHGDRVLENIGDLANKVKSGGAIPGVALKGAFGVLGAVLGGAFGRRGRRGRRGREPRDSDSD
ncbi:MAG: hypothetical protein O3C10_11260 [Chloroflexi bacterium]|nr:hypothetical protein [Chloroflexota bacterium]